MSNFKVELEGDEELLKDIKTWQDGEYLEKIIRDFSDLIKNTLSKYPPTSEANQPNRFGKWYQRGWGTRTSTGGTHTSENLKEKWYINLRGKEAEIGNTASYAVYVQGNQQTWFHKARGWLTLEDESEKEVPEIERSLSENFEKNFGE